jgi:hypothetical protein
MIQEQNRTLGSSLAFENLGSVPHLTSAVVKQSYNDFTRLDITRSATNTIVLGEKLHAFSRYLAGRSSLTSV